MSKIKYFILRHIFPGFYATYANKIVAENYDKQNNFDVDLTAITAGQEQDYIEQVKADLKEQHDRKKIIEDKAKSLLFIITVSITAITFSLTYLNSLEINVPQTIALILLSLKTVPIPPRPACFNLTFLRFISKNVKFSMPISE